MTDIETHVYHHANGRIEVTRTDTPGHEFTVKRFGKQDNLVDSDSYSRDKGLFIAQAIQSLARRTPEEVAAALDEKAKIEDMPAKLEALDREKAKGTTKPEPEPAPIQTPPGEPTIGE